MLYFKVGSILEKCEIFLEFFYIVYSHRRNVVHVIEILKIDEQIITSMNNHYFVHCQILISLMAITYLSLNKSIDIYSMDSNLS